MRRALLTVVLLPALVACETELKDSVFQRRAESVFMEVNPGFTVMRRRGMNGTGRTMIGNTAFR